MGQAMSYGLNQVEVDELVALSNGAFAQEEIEALYKRFRSLDRGRKGYVSAEEFLSIPELSINPLAKRLAQCYDGINFREFVVTLAPYSPRASRDDKLLHLFSIWDVDGDGIVSRDDMELIMRQMGGSAVSDAEARALADRLLAAAGSSAERGLSLAQFKCALEGAKVDLCVDVPVED